METSERSPTVAACVDALVERACEATGHADLGSDSWAVGLRILVDTLETAPEVTPEGRNDLYRQFVDALANRLRVMDYVASDPEVTEERVERPLVILGLPRTGTTVSSYLLDQDPARRSLLNWEAADSAPPATHATLRTDPRCLAMNGHDERLRLRADGPASAAVHGPGLEMVSTASVGGRILVSSEPSH